VGPTPSGRSGEDKNLLPLIQIYVCMYTRTRARAHTHARTHTLTNVTVSYFNLFQATLCVKLPYDM
jgi:hypothetical protein